MHSGNEKSSFFGILCLIIGVFLVLLVIFLAIKSFASNDDIKVASAKVTSVRYTGNHGEREGGRYNKRTVTYYDFTYGVTYTVNGKEYTNTVKRSHKTKEEAYKVNEFMNVGYDKDKPEVIRSDGESSSSLIFTGLAVMGVLIVVGILKLWNPRRYRYL